MTEEKRDKASGGITGDGCLGSPFEDFLIEQGIADEVNATALNRLQEQPEDKILFKVPEAAFTEFQQTLDAPPAPNENLRRFLTTKSPWDER